jgi:hypothetical protein
MEAMMTTTSLKLVTEILGVLVIASCNLPIPGMVSSTGESPSNQTITATQAPKKSPLEHRIRVRVVNGIGEFYDNITGQKFVPRGMNYVVMGLQQNRADEQFVSHATFAPGYYNRETAGKALMDMHSAGYNTVRVFIETTTTTSISGTSVGLSNPYLDNVADFIGLAAASDMFVIFVTDWIADSDPYNQIIARECCETFDSSNAVHLSASGVEASRRFYSDFVSGLIERDARLDHVFSFNVSNELAFDSNEPPLVWSSGLVTLGNDQSYDMSKPDDKKRIIDDGLVYYIDQVRAAILEVDPTSLVGVGFFAPQEPHPHRIGDTRVIRTYPAIWKSQADYVDLHGYPNPADLTLGQLIDNYEVNGMQVKPIILGEYGAFTFVFSNPQDAALALRAWQVESCKYGFDGWLMWTWDNEFNGEMFSALSDGGAINGALAPVLNPDPCN